MVSNVSRVWKPGETLALVFEILLLKCLLNFPFGASVHYQGGNYKVVAERPRFLFLLFNIESPLYQLFFSMNKIMTFNVKHEKMLKGY